MAEYQDFYSQWVTESFIDRSFGMVAHYLRYHIFEYIIIMKPCWRMGSFVETKPKRLSGMVKNVVPGYGIVIGNDEMDICH